MAVVPSPRTLSREGLGAAAVGEAAFRPRSSAGAVGRNRQMTAGTPPPRRPWTRPRGGGRRDTAAA